MQLCKSEHVFIFILRIKDFYNTIVDFRQLVSCSYLVAIPVYLVVEEQSVLFKFYAQPRLELASILYNQFILNKLPFRPYKPSCRP